METTERIWTRAWRDFERVATGRVWFAVVAAVASGVFGFGASALGPGPGWVGALSGVFSFMLCYGALFGVVVVKSLVSQRDEARTTLARHREESSGSKSPAEALAGLSGSKVTLNGHQTNYADVLKTCWQKLVNGATERTIEYELHHVAFLPPQDQKQQYLVAVPDLDFFFGEMRLIGALEIKTVRVPPDPFEGIMTTFPTARSQTMPQKIIGPTDEERYILTPFGLRIVELLKVSQ